jgi:hypothetical protein
MPYLAVDLDLAELISSFKPDRDRTGQGFWERNEEMVDLPSGTIKKLIGRELSWNDDPVELTEKMVKEPEWTLIYKPSRLALYGRLIERAMDRLEYFQQRHDHDAVIDYQGFIKDLSNRMQREGSK